MGVSSILVCRGEDMLLRFFQDAPDLTIAFIKGTLPLIGNVKEFEVYQFREDSPYIVEERGREQRYTFIVRDDRSNEVWLDTLCGYSGSGARATEEILQVLGLKKDFGIAEKPRIKEVNLSPIHHLNLLLGAPNTNFQWIGDDWVCMEFAYPSQLVATIQALRSLGHLNRASSTSGVTVPPQLKVLEQEYEWADYATNKTFLVNWELRSLSTSAIRDVIVSICQSNGGSYSILRARSVNETS